MSEAPDPSPPTVLTEDERADLEGACDGWSEYLCCQRTVHRKTKQPVGGAMLDVVERILADRMAAAVQAERERLGGLIATMFVYEWVDDVRVPKSPQQVRREAEAIARDGDAP